MRSPPAIPPSTASKHHPTPAPPAQLPRMPSEAKQRRTLIWLVGLLFLILISLHLYAAKAMDSLPAPFAIEIDGSPISKPASDSQDQTHASTGAEPAVFELKNKRLQCDGHVLARALAEDRSFAPKKVWWFKANTAKPIHDVVANKDGDSYQLQFSGAGLMAESGNVYADIMGVNGAKVVLKMQS